MSCAKMEGLFFVKKTKKKKKKNLKVNTLSYTGMETTANMLAFAVIALGRHPEVLHRYVMITPGPLTQLLISTWP